MEIGRKEIAEAGMVSTEVVRKAVGSGRLDEWSLLSIAGYIVLCRLSAGGLKAVTGMSPEPLIRGEAESFPVGRDTEKNSLSEGKVIDRSIAAELPSWVWSGTELMVMENMVNTFGKTRKKAEAEIMKMRETAGVEMLREEDLEGLGLL